MAAFTPDQTWEEILKQLIHAMDSSSKKLDTTEMGKFLAIAAAIHRKGMGSQGWWKAR
jgi:hypothetical protein